MSLKRLLLIGAFACLGTLAWLRIPQFSFSTRAANGRSYLPGPVPDRIILTWSSDPSTSQSVTWRTDASVRQAVAEIAVAEDGPLFVRSAKSVPAESQDFESDVGQARYHSVTFSGLTPSTMYVHRVGDGSNWSEWSQFQTTSDRAAPLTFLYVGDAQTNIFSMWSRLIRMGYTKAPEAQFIVHAGDLVNRGGRDEEWGEWFLAAGWINQSLPSVPSPGNHEYSGGKGLTRHWRTQYTLPKNGVPELEESCYYLDIQGVRMISLNSNEKQQEQAAWLDGILANNPNRWTVLAFHHPIHSAARSRDNKQLREAWQPVIDKYAVDLVLTGHDHTYARSNLNTGLKTRSERSGTVYVVSVSGPKMYNLTRETWMVRAAEDTQLFQVIRIAGDKLSYESRTARGVLYDAFELRKSRGGPNKLINRIPATPENLRKTQESGE
jgi:3',5'-cyclic AMP phosphodiesterase CpdA